MPLAPAEVRARLEGLLGFPVTPFRADYSLDVDRFRAHIEFQLEERPAGLFVCGGAGEFFSLTPKEVATLAREAVAVAHGRVPVLVGTGYGTRMAIDLARSIESAGADGLLLMPPYLVDAEQAGFYEHYAAVARSVQIGIVLYQRPPVLVTPTTVSRLAEIPNVIGFKDGTGDLDHLQAISRLVGDRLSLINGTPTAEASADAFAAIGITTYSSAIYNFIPRFARRFFETFAAGAGRERRAMLDEVIRPIAAVRERRKGYAVALIKAGLRIVGRDMGPVRPPLVDLTERDYRDLEAVISKT
jgi:5-dehydro-4-deoxyglucarate dehydratase